MIKKLTFKDYQTYSDNFIKEIGFKDKKDLPLNIEWCSKSWCSYWYWYWSRSNIRLMGEKK